MNFSEGATSLAGCAAVALTGSGDSKTAACSTSGLAVGTHNLVASYGGDAGNLASASTALAQVIDAVPDTTPPADVTGVVVSDAATGGRLNLSWVNPVADFAGVLVLRRAGVAVSDVPATGQSYSAGQALGASTVVYAGAGAGYADLNLANGTPYFYKIFAHDAVRNYAAGVAGSGTPTAPRRGLCGGGRDRQSGAWGGGGVGGGGGEFHGQVEPVGCERVVRGQPFAVQRR